MLSDREKLIRLPSSPSTRGICSQEVELDLCSLHTMFSRFASAARRAGRQLSTTAAAGDGSGFLIAGGVGVAAIACMAPRADEGHAAAPALPADEASKKLLAVLSHGEELAKIAWDYYLSRERSVIYDTFYGQLKSRVQCTQCDRVSITFDPFNVLSLPIPSQKN